ncbi:MAG TPA: hypothetical protein VF756_30635 [Thermoanaerobaculia bacterium]
MRVVTRDEYERRKRRLEEQLRAGVELLEAACQAQIRALDLVWMLQAEERGEAATWSAPAPAKPEPLPQPDRPRRRSAPEVEADVRAAFGRLPEAFTRRDVCEALGYEPDRAALYRILQTLTQEGVARVESAGEGQRATVYRKTGGHDSPAPA